ncbi:MAG: DUF4956 domain-containing protein [Candidatus Peregrinibacteria bacterium]|nr:DUF4956 domain-containing protein [Candidatus Peregrinibacteria bacterium]MDZ4245458.1 DUF4956 domain-containing protein [Candidatus Gracilibacteria bacterium]
MEFLDLFAGSKTMLSGGEILFNFGFAFVLMLALALTYKSTHKGLSYSQSFVSAIVLIGLITTAAMMIIGSNVVSAVALLGAFSIIRFRTPVKDVRDISFIFLSLVVGMGVGTENHQIALITTVVMMIIVFIFHYTNFGSIRKYGYILTFNFDSKKGKDNAFKAVFDKYLRTKTLLHVNAVKDGHTLDFTFNVNLKNNNDSDKFVDELSKVIGIEDVDFLTAKNDIEY